MGGALSVVRLGAINETDGAPGERSGERGGGGGGREREGEILTEPNVRTYLFCSLGGVIGLFCRRG